MSEQYPNKPEYSEADIVDAKYRESKRFQSGYYQELILPDELYVQLNNDFWWHFPHYSVEDNTKIAYCASVEALVEDRQTRIRPGRYFKKVFPHLSDEEITSLTSEFMINSEKPALVYLPPVPTVADTSAGSTLKRRVRILWDEIANYWQYFYKAENLSASGSSYPSCMRGKKYCRAYAFPGNELGLMVLFKPNNINQIKLIQAKSFEDQFRSCLDPLDISSVESQMAFIRSLFSVFEECHDFVDDNYEMTYFISNLPNPDFIKARSIIAPRATCQRLLRRLGNPSEDVPIWVRMYGYDSYFHNYSESLLNKLGFERQGHLLHYRINAELSYVPYLDHSPSLNNSSGGTEYGLISFRNSLWGEYWLIADEKNEDVIYLANDTDGVPEEVSRNYSHCSDCNCHIDHADDTYYEIDDEIFCEDCISNNAQYVVTRCYVNSNNILRFCYGWRSEDDIVDWVTPPDDWTAPYEMDTNTHPELMPFICADDLRRAGYRQCIHTDCWFLLSDLVRIPQTDDNDSDDRYWTYVHQDYLEQYKHLLPDQDSEESDSDQVQIESDTSSQSPDEIDSDYDYDDIVFDSDESDLISCL